jgi:hypothetical protein
VPNIDIGRDGDVGYASLCPTTYGGTLLVRTDEFYIAIFEFNHITAFELHGIT